MWSSTCEHEDRKSMAGEWSGRISALDDTFWHTSETPRGVRGAFHQLLASTPQKENRRLSSGLLAAFLDSIKIPYIRFIEDPSLEILADREWVPFVLLVV